MLIDTYLQTIMGIVWCIEEREREVGGGDRLHQGIRARDGKEIESLGKWIDVCGFSLA